MTENNSRIILTLSSEVPRALELDLSPYVAAVALPLDLLIAFGPLAKGLNNHCLPVLSLTAMFDIPETIKCAAKAFNDWWGFCVHSEAPLTSILAAASQKGRAKLFLRIIHRLHHSYLDSLGLDGIICEPESVWTLRNQKYRGLIVAPMGINFSPDRLIKDGADYILLNCPPMDEIIPILQKVNSEIAGEI